MMARLVAELGPWMWMVAGFVLLAFEVVVPRRIAFVLGCAAILTGTLTIMLQFTGMALATLPAQAAAFAVATIAASAAVGFWSPGR